MHRIKALACAITLGWGMSAAAATMQTTGPATAEQPASGTGTGTGATAGRGAAPAATPAAGDKPVVVTGRPRRKGVMHLFFGPNRRRGGFFKNLFHPKRGWQTTAGHRRHCKRRYRSYNPRTNSYRAYSGLRRVCVI